jgi:hypothetical protein
MDHTLIPLGTKVKCIVTEFTGIAVSRVVYLNGCVQYGVKPKVDKDGKMQDVLYIDAQQLEIVGEGVSVKQKQTGGPHPDAPNF